MLARRSFAILVVLAATAIGATSGVGRTWKPPSAGGVSLLARQSLATEPRLGEPNQPTLTYGALEFAGKVDPQRLPRASPGAAWRQQPPLRPGTAVLAPPAPRATTTAAQASSTLPLLTNFAGLGSTDNPVALQPPDVQVAVGPNQGVELVNITGRIFGKDGSVLRTFALAPFFSVPSGWMSTDPKVIYDAASGRFFASYVSFINGGTANSFGRLHFAVSTTSNPLDPWNVYYLQLQGDLPDNPGSGLTDDKVTVSYNRFQITTNPHPIYRGAQTLVIQKSDLLAGVTAPATVLSSPDTSLFAIRPAHSLSATSSQYMASADDGTSTVLHLFQVAGTPAAGNVTITNVANPTIGTLANPPDAQQAGASVLIATGDNRLLETVWRNGHLWASANAACAFTGDSAPRSCLKLIEVDTGANTVLQDMVYGASGEYFYYPAIRTAGADNLLVVFSHSSLSLFAETMVAKRLSSDPPNTLSSPQLLKAGEVAYSPSFGGQRWGDYLGAAADPANSLQVWVAGEYAKSDGFVNWGTYVAKLWATCADFNGDGIVTAADILYVVQHYGTTPTTPGWDPRADLNGDGIVTAADILIVVLEYGVTCQR